MSLASVRTAGRLVGWIATGTLGVPWCSNAANLTDLYQLALTSDPTFQSATFSLQAARQLRPEAFAALLPTLSATGSGSRTFGRTRYTSTPAVDRSYDADQWILQLTQPLFRMESILAYGEARAALEQAGAQFAAAEQDLILRLTRAYFDEVVAGRHVAAAHSQVNALKEQLQAARHSFDAGVASVTDVDDTQSRAALAEAQEVAIRNDLESARAVLESIIGTPAQELPSLPENPVLPRPTPADAESWVDHAIRDNPLVTAANAGIALSEFEVDRSRAQRLPTVDLVGTYGGNYSSGNITEINNYGTNVRDRQISVQISMPIFEGGAIRAREAEARAKKSKATADFTTAQRQAALSARQAYAAVFSGISQVRALETAVAAGKNAVKGNKVGYGLGIRINSDVLNAEQQLYSTVQDLEKARYDTLYAGLQLKAAAGELSADDLRLVTALLIGEPMVGNQ